MSCFTLKDQTCRRKRKGIWLRVRSNPDITRLIRKSGLKRLSECIEWVEIRGLRPEGKVLLEVWCMSLLDSARRRNRHNVFHIQADENPEWVCEGDLGRGM